MGTRVAPTLANLFMADFEERFVYTYHTQPKLWVRFIDDIFLIWDAGETELMEFIKHLNAVHDSIKFTHDISKKEIPFLDTVVKIHNGVLITDLYNKETDAHNYLHYRPSHPSQCKEGIPFGQFLCLRRICTREEDFIRHGLIMGAHFLCRGYPKDLIAEGLIRALNTPRPDPLGMTGDLQGSTQSSSPAILVTTFHPTFNSLKKVVKANWEILARSAKTQILHKQRFIVGMRKPPSLRDQLVQARLSYSKDIPDRHQAAVRGRSVNLCNNPNRRYCPRMNKSGETISSSTGRRYITKYNVNCQSSNLIYCLKCTRCNKQYVGQTKRRVMDRFQNHLYRILHQKTSSDMGLHFNSGGHQGLHDVDITILDFIHCSPNSTRAQKLRNTIERNWMFKLRTQVPFCMNLIDAPMY